MQVTYDGIGRSFSWDNTDIRYARTTNLFGAETVLGVSINNNPTVTDVWNTTPAWGYPFQASGLAPSPAAATMIEGEFSKLVGGATAYAYWNRLVYLEVGGYSTLSPRMQQAFGEPNSSTSNAINGVAPYWRLALQQEWGRNSLEVGMFGMSAAITPSRMFGFGRDKITDTGFDSQYQFLSDRDSFSLQASIIFENQDLAASSNPAIGVSDPLIHGIALYYAAKPPVPGTPGDPAEMAAGKKIFQDGIAGVPPCKSCHGEHAEGMGPIPRLAGQHRDYLVEQLQNFASNARANEIMHANSKPLTADEIREVTAYIAAQ